MLATPVGVVTYKSGMGPAFVQVLTSLRLFGEVPPGGEGKPNWCVILSEYKNPGADFTIGSSKHGLLLVIEVFRSEMEYAMKYGSQTVLNKLKEKGYYPYSDLDREPVF